MKNVNYGYFSEVGDPPCVWGPRDDNGQPYTAVDIRAAAAVYTLMLLRNATGKLAQERFKVAAAPAGRALSWDQIEEFTRQR